MKNFLTSKAEMLVESLLEAGPDSVGRFKTPEEMAADTQKGWAAQWHARQPPEPEIDPPTGRQTRAVTAYIQNVLEQAGFRTKVYRSAGPDGDDADLGLVISHAKFGRFELAIEPDSQS